jgi:hypothetical protein
MIIEKIILGGTLPVGAVSVRLLCSGEYSIRGTFDLIGKSSLYWFIYRFADALEHGSPHRVYGSLMPACLPRLSKLMVVRRAVGLRVSRRVRGTGETKVAGVLK